LVFGVRYLDRKLHRILSVIFGFYEQPENQKLLDPSLVKRDVAEGLVCPHAARDIYASDVK
jgi:hypothetical protein